MERPGSIQATGPGMKWRLRRSLLRRLKQGWAFSKMLVAFHVYLVHVPLNDLEMLSLRASDRRYKRYLEGNAEVADILPCETAALNECVEPHLSR